MFAKKNNLIKKLGLLLLKTLYILTKNIIIDIDTSNQFSTSQNSIRRELIYKKVDHQNQIITIDSLLSVMEMNQERLDKSNQIIDKSNKIISLFKLIK